MNIMEDTLYKKIQTQANWFAKHAARHKKMNHTLWFISSFTSVAIAICANFSFEILNLSSAKLTALLAIFLPVITGYTLLRGPENLWIMEIEIRNRLLDLKSKMELTAECEGAFDRTEFEEEYFAVLKDANSKWQEIKSK
ncbi:hypothetical protein ACMXYX_09995 [Neptuniibacter sp. QD72_48]|uniref:hypothetical protein n=1 Tax=unclassified Neptuniibacter TaxID=2630693 RepID=UPI0039F59A6A